MSFRFSIAIFFKVFDYRDYMYNHIENNIFTDKLEVQINAHIVKYAILI